jgi:hypothetical protein
LVGQPESTTSSSLSGSLHHVNRSVSSLTSSSTLPVAPKNIDKKTKSPKILETSKSVSETVPAEKKTEISPKTKVVCLPVDNSTSFTKSMGKPSSLPKIARVRTDDLVPLKTLFMQSVPSTFPATKPDPVNKVTVCLRDLRFHLISNFLLRKSFPLEQTNFVPCRTIPACHHQCPREPVLFRILFMLRIHLGLLLSPQEVFLWFLKLFPRKRIWTAIASNH